MLLYVYEEVQKLFKRRGSFKLWVIIFRFNTVFRFILFKIKDADELYNFVRISFADFKHPLEPELKLAAVLD